MSRIARLSSRLWAALALAMLVSWAGPALCRGDGFIIVRHGPVVVGHFSFAPLEVSYHHVSVDIDDPVATTTVEEEFYNPNPQALEGTYIFPLPAGAHIDKFSMDVNGKMMDAELLSADKAREIYEDVMRKAKDPALLEYVGRDAFRVRIFPIEANGRKTVKLTYTQLVKSDSGISEYDYPLNTEKFSSRPLKDVWVKVSLTCKEPIKTIYSPSHNVDIRHEGAKHAIIAYEERDVRPDMDFRLMYSHRDSELGINLLTYRNSGDDGYFLLMASPGVEIKSGAVQPKDITLILDTSGSMAGVKMEQAKKALAFCVNSLDEQDRFEIIRFSTEPEPLFNELRPANKENVAKALEFVSKLRASGATAIDDALRDALKMRAGRSKEDSKRPYEVIFLTDGMPTIGETNEDTIVDHVGKWSQGTRVFCFGLGNDVNPHLLDRIAEQTGAVSQYVLPKEDIELKLSNFYAKIREPALCDVEVKFGSPGELRTSRIYPKHMPDLFKGQTLLAFGRYSGSGAGCVKISGTVNGEKKEFAADVDFTKNDTQNAFVAQLWATREVGWLLDEIRLHGESKELKDEVVRVAREFGIVTPYTAYLIIEDERKRAVPVTDRSFQQLERDREASDFAKNNYESLRTEAADEGARGGKQAVNNAMSLNDLKDSNNMQQTREAGAARQPAMGGGGGFAYGSAAEAAPAASLTPAAPQGYRQAQNYVQQARMVNGRAFYQNGNTWTDSTIQANAQAKRQRITFNSDEYFELMKKYPIALPWLSLGTDVDISLDGMVYEIRAGA